MSQERVQTGILNSSWAVFLYAFVAVSALLFAPQGPTWFGPGGSQIIILVFLSTIGIWLLSDLDHSLRVVLGNALVFAIPILALISALWSIYPTVTIRAALQLLPTLIAALLLGSSRRIEPAIIGVFAAYFLYLVISLAFGRTVATGFRGETAAIGLNFGKNFFGNTAAYGVMLSIAVAGLGLARRNVLLIGAGGACLLVAIYCLLMSKATGSLIAVTIASAGLGVAVILSRVPLSSRLLLLLVLALFMLPILVEIETIRHFFEEFVFKTFKKDAGLTGRLLIWKMGDALIAERPWLGYGYNAFWTQGNLDAETLWGVNNIVTRTGFNFHSQPREMLINLGWVGFSAIVLSVAPMLLNLFKRLLAAPNIVVGFWLAILIYTFTRMPVESVGPAPFSMDTLLFFAALTGPAVRLAQNWNQMPQSRSAAHAAYREEMARRMRRRPVNPQAEP